jgi:hypothetical protein
MLQNVNVLRKNTLQPEGKRQKKRARGSGEEHEPNEGRRGRRSRIAKIKIRRGGGEAEIKCKK